MEFSEASKFLKEKEKAFMQRFLPDEARSGHGVLFDPDEEIHFIPSAQELQACLEGYLIVIEAAAHYHCEAVRGRIEASELVLGYLGRARRAGIDLPESPARDRLVFLIENTLLEAQKVHQRPIRLDGYKRIYDIAYMLGTTIKSVL